MGNGAASHLCKEIKSVVHRYPQSNNGMHPTANSVAFMRETPANQRFVAARDAGR